MAETTIDARVTMYGFPDNDPPFSANIAPPVLHQQASGIGTFDDPITFAGDPGDIPFGTKIYVPHVQKYFIMEDTCADAMASPNDGLHVDLWAGGSANTDVQQLLSVENGNTRSSAQVILNAEPGHPVNLTPFDGSSTPHTAAQTPASAATADTVSEVLASIPAQAPSAKAALDLAPVSAALKVTTTETASNAVPTDGAGESAPHGQDDTFYWN